MMRALLDSATAVIDMYAVSEDGMTNVSILFQKISAFYGTLLTEEDIVDANIADLPEMLAQLGHTDLAIEKATIRLGEDEHVGFAASSTYMGLPFYQAQVSVLCGDYVAFVCVTSFLADNTDEVLANFYAL